MERESVDRRRQKRISAMILCEIRIGDRLYEIVRVRDLNETGVKIAFPRALRPGDRLSVRMPGKSDWNLARVVWCAEGFAGLSFAQAIELAGIPGARAQDEVVLATASLDQLRMAG